MLETKLRVVLTYSFIQVGPQLGGLGLSRLIRTGNIYRGNCLRVPEKLVRLRWKHGLFSILRGLEQCL